MRRRWKRSTGLMPRIYGLFESWVRPLDEEDGLQPPARLVPFVWHSVRQAKAPFALMLAIGGIAPLVDASLNSVVKAAIQQNLHALMHGKTVIAVAHRLSTIAHLDRLVVPAGGRIVESGTHADLLAEGGLYARLWQRQSGARCCLRR